METTFYNVTITIEAPTPKEAYTRLCELLAADDGVEWETDTYSKDDELHDTNELFPTEEDVMPLDQQVAREHGANTSYDDKE